MKIADIELGEHPLLLAPMEDVTDPSFRYMCKRFGADVVYTEFISSDGQIAQETRDRRRGASRGDSDLRPPDRTDGRGGADGRGRRSRHHRHQLRLSCEEDRRARRRVGHDARRTADGRDDAADRCGGQDARDGQDPSRMGRRIEKHRRDSPPAAGRRHRGAHDPRPHTGPDVPRRGGLDADRPGSSATATSIRARRPGRCSTATAWTG